MRICSVILVLILALPALSSEADVPHYLSWVEVEPGRFVITPGGSGPSLADQGVSIQVWIRDDNNLPVSGWPFQDIWLDDKGSGDIVLCQGGSSADSDTDAEGHTTISHSIAGGGWTQEGMSVYIKGVAIAQTPEGSDFELPLEVNSPDINGDRTVDISDISIFAGDVESYAFRSDFNFDGNVDLSDISLFNSWLGEDCP